MYIHGYIQHSCYHCYPLQGSVPLLVTVLCNTYYYVILYIIIIYYIVGYTLRTNNGIIFMIFITFISFIYTFYCYSFITMRFAFAFVCRYSVGRSVGDRYKPIIRQVGYIVSLCSCKCYQVIRLSG